MDEGLPSVSIIAFFVILIIDVFVHGFGMALEHVSKDEIEKKSTENKDELSSKLLRLLDDEMTHIESMQILTIILNMVLGGLVTVRLSEYLASLWNAGGNVLLLYLCILLRAL